MEKPLKDFTSQEISLLQYLEARAVDHFGRVDMTRVNDKERGLIDAWNAVGFIAFGRICARDVRKSGSNWVRLSDQAWDIAHQSRRRRADKNWLQRTFQTTAEKLDAPAT